MASHKFSSPYDVYAPVDEVYLRRFRNSPRGADSHFAQPHPPQRRNLTIFSKYCLTERSFCDSIYGVDWVWRSLVACLNGVQEAGSSNLLTQT